MPIVFCGGIGENSCTIREAVPEAMEWIGIEIGERNRTHVEILSSDRSRVRVFLIRTNEERMMIARHTDELLAQREHGVHRVA